MDPYLSDVLDVLLRMLHVIAGIAWIGASFYFVRLDLALRPPKRQRGRRGGRRGRVLGRPRRRPLPLAEVPPRPARDARAAALVQVGGVHDLALRLRADGRPLLLRRRTLRLVDPDVADLAAWQAIALSVGGLALAWVVYDVLCRTVGQRSQVALAVVGIALLALAAWGASELFAPRAAYLQVGAMLGTIMAANVLFVIIPAHRKLVRAMEEKREPDAAPLPRGEAPLGAQQLPHAARALHDARRALRVHRSAHDEAWLVLVARSRSLTALSALLQPLARRAARVVDPGCAAVAVVALALWLEPDEAAPSADRPVAFARGAADRRSSAARPATRAPPRRSASGSRRGADRAPAPTTSSGRPC